MIECNEHTHYIAANRGACTAHYSRALLLKTLCHCQTATACAAHCGAATGNEALAIQADVAKLQELGKFYAEISQKLGKIDLLFAEETLDVCAVDGFILEIRETLRSWKRRYSGPK